MYCDWQWGPNVGITAGQGQSPEVACAAQVAAIVPDINATCCADPNNCPKGATGGFPTSCSDDCAGVWMPVWTSCEVDMSCSGSLAATRHKWRPSTPSPPPATSQAPVATTAPIAYSRRASRIYAASRSARPCPRACRHLPQEIPEHGSCSSTNGFYNKCSARVAQMPQGSAELHGICTGGGGHQVAAAAAIGERAAASAAREQGPKQLNY